MAMVAAGGGEGWRTESARDPSDLDSKDAHFGTTDEVECTDAGRFEIQGHASGG